MIWLGEYIFWRERNDPNNPENKRIQEWRGIREESADRQRQMTLEFCCEYGTFEI